MNETLLNRAPDIVLPRAPASFQARPSRARAYCGASHGVSWDLADPEEPADLVALVASGTDSIARYRLVRHRLTRRPVTDRLGNLIYLAEPERVRPDLVPTEMPQIHGPKS